MRKTENDIRGFSLLAPRGEDGYFDISKTAAGDLSIGYIAESRTKNSTEENAVRNILLRMPTSERIISYRSEIYAELRDDPELCGRLYEIFDAMRFYNSDRMMRSVESTAILDMLTRLKSLESYIGSVLRIREVIEGREFRSEGLRQFAGYVKAIYTDSGFDELMKDITEISDDFSLIRSMTLGVNFDANFCPKGVGILSLNKYPFTDQSILKRFIKYHGRDQLNDDPNRPFFEMEIHDSLDRRASKFQANPPDMMTFDDPLMNNLNSIIERMLPSMTARLRKFLDRYVDVSGKILADLADEFLFYRCFIALEDRLTGIGIPCCRAEISGGDTLIKDFCSVKLAINRMRGEINEDVILNDIEFTKDRTVWILTGPNRGGKTVLTQGIGLAFLLFQSGVFVPAASAEIRPCDGIYTHFPVEEERTVSLGRLGEEAERFSEMCRTAGSGSLLLFNESFATTSHTESLYIAADVLKYLCCIGARTCFNTHMHELAEQADDFGACEKAVCGAVSVVMENDDGKRSYKLSFKKPDGKSYAHEIAYKYGITFEQLIKDK